MVDRVSFIRLTPGGPTEEHCKAMLAKAGYPVKHDDDPCFVEPYRKPTKRELRVAHIDMLKAAILRATPGCLFGVLDISQFGSLAIWFEVAPQLAARRARVEFVQEGIVLDPTLGEDVAKGAAMINAAINRRKGRTMTEKRLALGITGGAPLKIRGARLKETQDLYVDLSVSVPEIAFRMNVSRSTIIRAMGVPREEAIRLYREGKWPPKPKRRPSNIKPAGDTTTE